MSIGERPERATSDEGIGLIEIVVSMFVLALIALAFLPLLTTSVKTSASNSKIAAAAQVVSDQIEAARNGTYNCDGLRGYAGATVPDVTVGAYTFDITRSVPGSCPDATYPGTAVFSVSVTEAGSSKKLADASTRILVSE